MCCSARFYQSEPQMVHGALILFYMNPTPFSPPRLPLNSSRLPFVRKEKSKEIRRKTIQINSSLVNEAVELNNNSISGIDFIKYVKEKFIYR